MLKSSFGFLAFSAFLVLGACSTHHKDKIVSAPVDASSGMPVTQEGLDKMTKSWPASSQSAIKSLTQKYGLPSAVTDDMVIWNNSTPFKRSVVTKEEVTHKFPMEHSDVLLQTVDYRVPADKIPDLSKFDGSLIVDRTKGELSSRNDNEAMNILAFNLADRIVRGESTVEQARRDYARNAEAFATGTTTNLLTSLNFKAQGDTRDPDSMIQSEQIRKTIKTKKVEKVMED